MTQDIPVDLRTLTAFRFLAAVWVLLFHLDLRIDSPDTRFWALVENGARGVDFFFILSGFVLLHVYDRQIRAGTFSFRNYMRRRFARIYPLHLVMLLVFLALALAGGNSTEGTLPSLLLLHAWNVTDGLVLNGPSWTLSAEMFAYVVFGLIALRPIPTWGLLAALVLSAAIAHFVALWLERDAFIHLSWDFGIFRILPLFILGMLLRRLAPKITLRTAWALLVFGTSLLVWLTQQDAGYEIILPFCCLILAGARLSDQAWLPTNSRVAVYLGEISYATYMVHIFAIALWFDYLPKLGLPILPLPLLGLAVLVASSLSYHLIERPARRWLTRGIR